MGSDTEKVWHEDDAFWETVSPVLFSAQRWERAEQEVTQMLALLNLPEGAQILDVACGPGRHALELARRGYAVTCIDRTASYLEKVRLQADAEGLALEVVHADMREFVRPGRFHAVLNLFSSFGYFADPRANFKTLKNMHNSLRPGGQLLMDLLGKELLIRHFVARSWSEEGGVYLLEERRVMDAWRSMNNRWIVINQGETREFTWDMQIYSAVELSDMCKQCGFISLEVYGDLEGAAYDLEASRLILVARREYRIPTLEAQALGHDPLF